MTHKTTSQHDHRTRLCTIAALALVATLYSTGPATCAPREEAMKTPYRVLFLGDSITYGGLFIDYIEAFAMTRIPAERLELINLGLPSETLSGLSEPGHAGGAFPRPDVADRLDRTLEATHPDLVFACYGMNDGIYFPLSEERFASFRRGIENLVARLNAHSIPFVLLTPPPFDPVPIMDRTTPLVDGEWPGHGTFRDYDGVLAKYSTWLLERRKRGWHVIDLHGPMSAHLSERRRDDPEYMLARDGVHQSAFGHWLMAQQIVTHYQPPALVDTAEIDVEAGSVVKGHISGLAVDNDIVSFSWSTKQPLPMDARWDPKSVDFESVIERFNRHVLIVKGLSADEFRLYERDTLVGVVTREELAAGINLVRYPQLSTNQNGPEILGLIRERQALLTHAWLTDIGHTRPGLPEGLPVAEATDQAAELEVRIRGLAGPMRLDLRLVATAEADDDVPIPRFPGTRTEYRGFDRYDFTCDGVPCLVVTPKAPAPGNPWIWRAEFFDHRPEADLALLARGLHLAYIQVGNTFGCPDAMAHWDVFYRELTETYGLPVLLQLGGGAPGQRWLYLRRRARM